MVYTQQARATETGNLIESDARDAEDQAFSLLVHRQNRFVFRVAYAMLRRVEDAEDVAQEIFLKLYRSGGWKQMRDERAFLARATWRLAQDRRRAQHATSSPLEPDEVMSALASPEEQTLSASAIAAIDRLIDTLPEKLRHPLVLSGIEELSSQEISLLLGVPPGTVRTRLQRARQLMKEKLRHLEADAVLSSRQASKEANHDR